MHCRVNLVQPSVLCSAHVSGAICGAEAHSDSTLPSAPDEAREDAYVEAEAASRGEADTVPDDLPSSAHDAAHRLRRAASSHSVLYARLRRTALLALSLCRQFCALQGFPTDAMPCDSAATLIARRKWTWWRQQRSLPPLQALWAASRAADVPRPFRCRDGERVCTLPTMLQAIPFDRLTEPLN